MTAERELVALGLAVRLSREERGTDTGELAATAGIDRGCLEEIEAGRCASACACARHLDGEHVQASRCARRLDYLELISI